MSLSVTLCRLSSPQAAVFSPSSVQRSPPASSPAYALMCFHFTLTALLIKIPSRDQTSARISFTPVPVMQLSAFFFSFFALLRAYLHTDIRAGRRTRSACVCDSDFWSEMWGGKKKWSANIKHLVYMEPSFLRERAARHPICTRTSHGKLVFMLLGTVISRWGFSSAALLKISVVGFCRGVPLILLLVTCQAGLSPHALCRLSICILGMME